MLGVAATFKLPLYTELCNHTHYTLLFNVIPQKLKIYALTAWPIHRVLKRTATHGE
jgi:hypothetical protein